MSLWDIVFIYFLGGITFLPLCVLAMFFLLSSPKTESKGANGTYKVEKVDLVCDPNFKTGDIEELKGVEATKTGWIYVTNKYYYHSSELHGMSSAEKEALPTRDKLKRTKKFYAILKHGNLFLCKSDAQNADVFQVIVMKDTFVTMWPRDTMSEISDGSLFSNKTCISILKNGKAFLDQNEKLHFAEESSIGPTDQYFVYVPINVDKEDWYFTLINASKISQTDSLLDPSKSASTAHLRTKDLLSLIQIVHSTEGQFSTKWLNALINRLFLSLQQTEMLNNLLKDKIHKKLTKINKPGFLDDFHIEHIDVGTLAPIITDPKLLEMSPDGTTRVRFNLQYKGNLSLIISTKVHINLGSRFKNRRVTIELAITVRQIEGPLIILVKPPPSNRLWYAFETEPLLNIEVEPVVSTRQLSYNMITNVIKSKFKEALKESLVLPSMDDMVFYSTTDEIYRGGIWLNNTKSDNNAHSSENTDDYADTISINNLASKVEAPSSTALPVEKNNYHSNSPERRSSGISPKSFYEDDNSATSYRKPQEGLHSSDSDSASEKESLSGVGEYSLKTKTMHRVGTLKNMIKARTGTDSTIRSIDSNSSIDSSGSKKYFQSGMKKIGRWYKDQVNNAREVVAETQYEISHKNDTLPYVPTENEKIIGPEMISSRRSQQRLKSQPDQKDENVKLSAESNVDMFVNRARATSFEAPKSPNIPYQFDSTSPETPTSATSGISRRHSVKIQLERTQSTDSLHSEVKSNPSTEILVELTDTKDNDVKENNDLEETVSVEIEEEQEEGEEGEIMTEDFPAGASSILTSELNAAGILPSLTAEKLDLDDEEGYLHSNSEPLPPRPPKLPPRRSN
ncbi:HBL097Cp [Eremothecium sinecaudum]|uniref:HBL097Cp n=1 Tax=Eremothecium sinecaudum TaxID=45286 RepID=A0A125RDX0_9SACH|nr:HBL097Cp [Eremothecium sinecaudum]AMD18805.1 HBL097Cp [Eremothecium sinecaudum]